MDDEPQPEPQSKNNLEATEPNLPSPAKQARIQVNRIGNTAENGDAHTKIKVDTLRIPSEIRHLQRTSNMKTSGFHINKMER